MSFFKKNLEELSEADLLGLEKEEIPESIRLEFKRELNLADRKEKAEAAKDVSALANTAGGRILYGVDEKQLPDGSTAAGPLCPLTDGTLDSRLEDVLLSSISPQPRLRTRKVGVNDGFVLLVEVYPAYSGDLYMVTGFKENRFYRRGEQRTILMTEPEIREAYARIAASRQALEASIEEMIASELAIVPHLQQSAIVVPWYGHRQLVDPRQLGISLGLDLASGILSHSGWRYAAPAMKIVADGYRGHNPDNAPLAKCHQYISIRRNGLVHFATGANTLTKDGDVLAYAEDAFESIVGALLTARHILDMAAYWGPVRIVHRLRVSTPWYWVDVGQEDREVLSFPDRYRLDPSPNKHVVPEVNLKEFGTTLLPVLREVLDQLFQTASRERCPWFDASGNLRDSVRSGVSPEFLKYLEA